LDYFYNDMKPEELKKTLDSIAREPAHPGYYLFGDEDYIKRRIIAAIRHVTVPPDFADFNFDEFWGGELRDGKPFFDALLAVPMMVGQRLVLLREAEKAPRKVLESLVDFHVPKGNVLIVESVPARKDNAFHKGMVKLLVGYECAVANDREMVAWVISMAADRELDFDRDTAMHLVERAGINLDAIAAELDKLSLVSADGRPGIREIDNLTVHSRSANIFKFSDSFASRDFAKTLKAAQRLFGFGESGTVLLAFLKRELFTLLRLKTDPDAASNIRAPKWKLKHYAKWAEGWDIKQIRTAIIALAEADLGIKTGRLSERQALIEGIARAKF